MLMLYYSNDIGLDGGTMQTMQSAVVMSLLLHLLLLVLPIFFFFFVLRPCGILLGMRKYLDVSMHIASSLIDLYRLFYATVIE